MELRLQIHPSQQVLEARVVAEGVGLIRVTKKPLDD